MVASRKTVALVVVSGVVVLAGALDIAVAGSLEPPAPPAPTMTTLDEVEPRTPIHANNFPYVIAEPGSYYLAEDVTTFDSGIYITSDDVTLDLMGYRLHGGGSNGIDALIPVNNVVIRNGTVSGWGMSGIDVNGSNIRIESIHALDNTLDGIVVDDHVIVRNCTAMRNRVGIKIGDHGSVIESIASDNRANGIESGGHVKITSCAASGNADSGIRVAGGGIVRDSVSDANEDHGISVGSDCYVLNNNVYGNVFAGLHVDGSGNRIDGNNIVGNGLAFSLVGTGNTIFRNTWSGNGTSTIEFPNDLGPISNAALATSPWTNISF